MELELRDDEEGDVRVYVSDDDEEDVRLECPYERRKTKSARETV